MCIKENCINIRVPCWSKKRYLTWVPLNILHELIVNYYNIVLNVLCATVLPTKRLYLDIFTILPDSLLYYSNYVTIAPQRIGQLLTSIILKENRVGTHFVICYILFKIVKEWILVGGELEIGKMRGELIRMEIFNEIARQLWSVRLSQRESP